MTRAKLVWLALLVTIAFGSPIGCYRSSTVARARDALARVMASTNEVRDAFTTWDARHQKQIVLEAKTRDEAERRLTAHRTNRQAVLLAFQTVYLAIGQAASDLLLLESGKVGVEKIAASLRSVAEGHARAATALRKLMRGGGEP